MSAPTTTRRQLLNAKAYFIPYGETVSAAAVAATAWPATTTMTAWSPYEITDIEKADDVRAVSEEKIMVPSDLGGYWEDYERMLTGLGYELATSKSNSYIEQLALGRCRAHPPPHGEFV
ncbi:MAG: hypothetical protein QM680_14190 [Luteolibacter sp.]